MKKIKVTQVFTFLLAFMMLVGSVSCSKNKKAQKTQEPVQKEGKVREYKN
ncbi:MAG: hypothetical protein IPM47_16490 [Sphingobacteriales bacterium]|nr:MAG: hypothetical protein IPM47_16490 [Sphingobacteriales bacterium]